MTRVLMAVSGSDHWTLADGTRHPCGFWPEELVVPHQVFTAAGYDVVVATPNGVRPVPDEAGFTPAMNGGSTEPGERFRAYLAGIDADLASPADLYAVSAADYDLVFIPGGHGPMEDLARCTGFGALVAEFTAADKPVAAVCHGPSALLTAVDDAGQWLFAGRRLTGFTNEEESQVGFAERAPWLLEDRIVEAGGKFESSGAPWASHVVVDGNLHTGQNPAASGPLAEELVAALAGVG